GGVAWVSPARVTVPENDTRPGATRIDRTAPPAQSAAWARAASSVRTSRASGERRMRDPPGPYYPERVDRGNDFSGAAAPGRESRHGMPHLLRRPDDARASHAFIVALATYEREPEATSQTRTCSD